MELFWQIIAFASSILLSFFVGSTFGAYVIVISNKYKRLQQETSTKQD